ncbi:MAG: PilN domain-containing protein [Gallionella sp.]|nr:PilN domain-containing protein [Gallionella sp.]
MSQQINLFNPVFLKQQKLFSLKAMLQGLVLILLVSSVFYGYAVYQVSELSRQSEESTVRFNAEQARVSQYSAEFSPQQANQLLEAEISQLEKQEAESRKTIDALRSGAVGNTAGFSEYMRAFARQARTGLWLTGFHIAGDAAQISLSGATTAPESVPAYIQRLGREGIMQGKSFSDLNMQAATTTTKGVVEFTLNSAPDKGGAP